MFIKRILYGLPLALVAVFVLLFLIASQNFSNRQNEVVFPSIGDAEKLNPILATDTASSDVNDLVFNGLMKYDENLVLVGDLAASYDLAQSSICYVNTDTTTAQDVVDTLAEQLTDEQKDAYHITAIAVDSDNPSIVRIDFSYPGKNYEEDFLDILGKESFLPIYLITVLLDDKTELAQDVPTNARNVIAHVKSVLKKQPLSSGTILEYSEESKNKITIKVLADDAEVLEVLKTVVADNRGAIADDEKSYFDNTPVITFHLHDNVYWHDGEKFTARDVLFTYNKIMDETTLTVRRPMFEPVKKIEIIDDYTLKVYYKFVFSPSLENWSMGILPEHILGKRGVDINQNDFNRNPVGTGPFIFDEWVPDQRITLIANENYFKGTPALNRVSFRIIPDFFTLEQAFLEGSADFLSLSSQPFSIQKYKKDPRFTVFAAPSLAYTYIGWNLREKMFADVNVRRALTHAVNRKEIIEAILNGNGVIATGPFPNHMWYSNPNVKPLVYDPDLARKMLADAGWKDTNGNGILDKDGVEFEFELAYNQGNDIRRDIAVLTQRHLREIGIAADVKQYEWATFISDVVNARKFDAYVLGWSLSVDPDQYEIWHSSQIEKGFNTVAYSNPEVDKLLEQGRTEYDIEKRKAIYWKMHEIINEDQPYLFLYVPYATTAMHKGEFKVRHVDPQTGGVTYTDITMSPTGQLLYNLEDWIRTNAIKETQAVTAQNRKD